MLCCGGFGILGHARRIKYRKFPVLTALIICPPNFKLNSTRGTRM